MLYLQLIATGLRNLLLNDVLLTRSVFDTEPNPNKETIETLAECVYHVLTAESYGTWVVHLTSRAHC